MWKETPLTAVNVRPRARGKYHPGMFTDNVRVAFVPAREANTSKYCPDCSACMPFAHAREAKALTEEQRYFLLAPFVPARSQSVGAQIIRHGFRRSSPRTKPKRSISRTSSGRTPRSFPREAKAGC